MGSGHLVKPESRPCRICSPPALSSARWRRRPAVGRHGRVWEARILSHEEAAGRRTVASNSRMKQASKFLSYVLRHSGMPSGYGSTMRAGRLIEDLVKLTQGREVPLSRELIEGGGRDKRQAAFFHLARRSAHPCEPDTRSPFISAFSRSASETLLALGRQRDFSNRSARQASSLNRASMSIFSRMPRPPRASVGRHEHSSVVASVRAAALF